MFPTMISLLLIFSKLLPLQQSYSIEFILSSSLDRYRSSIASLANVKNSRIANGTMVLQESVGFRLSGISWNTETKRNQMFDVLWNCSNKFLGRIEYLV
ncbi:unnamed protein product [Blepharisma stoltei]|uniref:Uncharacterized protein n=1 Tax=Blepharisma stoltei TaxID=1481888 RepID=A0AAU9IMR8_9CILI|nr:unnamed protein product [Blepharisma stoltei]